jgi:DNA-directed RNA polymerase specialized sigma24 family protein
LDLDRIITRCWQGDTAAFDILVSRYQPRVYDLACSMLRDETAAHDVVQDTARRLWNHRPLMSCLLSGLSPSSLA